MDKVKVFEDYVAALRSGNYKQTFMNLRESKEDGTECFCALGVLADVVEPAGWQRLDEEIEWDHAAAYSIPEDVFGTLRFLNDDNLTGALWTRNDGVGFKKPSTFDEIADWLEENREFILSGE